MHILLCCCHDQRVKDEVLGWLSKQCARGVYVYWCALDQRFTPLVFILPGRVPDEARTRYLSDVIVSRPHKSTLWLYRLMVISSCTPMSLAALLILEGGVMVGETCHGGEPQSVHVRCMECNVRVM